MELTPNKLYQLKATTVDKRCLGCIVRCLPINRTRGAIVNKAYDCMFDHACVFTVSGTWVEISEEQAMEVMLGG